MLTPGEARARLAEIPSVTVVEQAPLARYTRFGIGGPVSLLVETASPRGLPRALEAARSSGLRLAVIGGGTNLICADAGFAGIVLRYTAHSTRAEGTRLLVEAGAVLEDVVEFSLERGLGGLESLAGIPGWTGAAVYGNAGAYGHSISERIRLVHYYDGRGIGTLDNSGCRFRYRDSVFKARKDWVILSAELELDTAPEGEPRAAAAEILRLRNQKYPPDMKCAGSIFKNLILSELDEAVRTRVPPGVVREGKVPAAWFLEQVGAKGESRGGIRVADYHANLIYNQGEGTARDLCLLIDELKRRVRERFHLDLEEEVQYLGS